MTNYFNSSSKLSGLLLFIFGGYLIYGGSPEQIEAAKWFITIGAGLIGGKTLIAGTVDKAKLDKK